MRKKSKNDYILEKIWFACWWEINYIKIIYLHTFWLAVFYLYLNKKYYCLNILISMIIWVYDVYDDIYVYDIYHTSSYDVYN